MSSEFDWRPGAEIDLAEESLPRPSRGTPGKATVTSRMAVPSVTNVIFRVADPAAAQALAESLASSGSRVAVQRDSNGVANGAEEAVSRAASSSGSPLPEPVREKFESSLGADLSRVRLHTGSESAAAAKAVGARAYTVGQDIHFGEGQYGGPDPFSMHLLAHEVAHTVQQSRSGGLALQNKLAVSTPLDSAEREADAAAAAMLAGESFKVTQSPGQLARFEETGEPVYDPDKPSSPNYNPYANVEETQGGNRIKWEEHVHQPGQTNVIEHEGLNVYGPEARAAGYAPSPDDPYGQDPSGNDWSSIELIGPNNPGSWAVSFAPKQPQPVGKMGKNRVTGEDEYQTIPVTRAQKAFAQSCVEAFRGPYDTAQASWTAMTGHVQAFQEAGKDPMLQEGGLNWLPTKKEAQAKRGQTMSQIAEGVKVGHKEDGAATHTVKEVAELTDDQVQELKHKDSDGAKDTLQDLAGDVAAANNKVGLAYKEAADKVTAHNTAISALSTAGKGVDITRMKQETAAEKAKVAQAERQKAEVMVWVGLVTEGYEVGKGLAKDLGIGFMTKKIEEGTKAVFTHLFTSNFDAKIKNGASKIASLASQMSALSDEISTDTLQQAAQAALTAASEMKTAKDRIGPLLKEADAAYKKFADQAAKQAGKGNKKRGDEVRAALEALPKIALVAQYAQSVVSAISLPGYSDKAGKGMLGAAQPPANFVQSVGEMRGYQTEFGVQADHWSAARDRCEAIAKSYGLND